LFNAKRIHVQLSLRLRFATYIETQAPVQTTCTADNANWNAGVANSEGHASSVFDREIEKFNIRQPPKGEKDDYDSENSWISDGFPSFDVLMDLTT